METRQPSDIYIYIYIRRPFMMLAMIPASLPLFLLSLQEMRLGLRSWMLIIMRKPRTIYLPASVQRRL